MADVLTQLKTFLPAAFAEDVHARAEDLLQARAASVAAPVDEALRTRVGALEQRVLELMSEMDKQRDVVPEIAAQRLDEEQRRALAALLTGDVLQVPPEAMPPPTPDALLELDARRCEEVEKRAVTMSRAAQDCVMAAGALRNEQAAVAACDTSHSIHEAIVDKENSRNDLMLMRSHLRQQAGSC